MKMEDIVLNLPHNHFIMDDQTSAIFLDTLKKIHEKQEVS